MNFILHDFLDSAQTSGHEPKEEAAGRRRPEERRGFVSVSFFLYLLAAQCLSATLSLQQLVMEIRVHF